VANQVGYFSGYKTTSRYDNNLADPDVSMQKQRSDVVAGDLIIKPGSHVVIVSETPSPSGERIILEIGLNEEPGRENIVIDGETEKKYNLPGKISSGTYPNIILGSHSYFRWRSDGKKIIFTLLKDDGHKELSGDLFLCNWDGTDIRKIKFETTRIRRNPSFGPPNMITYRYDEEDNLPCIGVAELFSGE